jgi:hypothetical protein
VGEEFDYMSLFKLAEYPEQKIEVNGTEVSNEWVYSIVTGRENGLADCTLLAINTDGETFLSSINVGDEVQVYYRNLGVSTTWYKRFKGKVIECNPSLDKDGEVVSVQAIASYGRPLKNMRVAQDYGLQMVGTTIYSKMREILVHMQANFIYRLLKGPLTGYSIGTNYIYGISDTVDIPYILFPYESAFDSLQDLIKLENSARYKAIIDASGDLDDWRGLHWIMSEDGDLYVAPVGDHHVQGNTGYWVDTQWPTYALSGNVLAVGQDTISAKFTKEEPLANVILVAGKYVYPKNEVFTEGNAAEWSSADLAGGAYTLIRSNDSDNCTKGSYSLKLSHNSSTNSYLGQIAAYHPLLAEFTKLVTRNTPVTIAFSRTFGEGVVNPKLLLMKDASNYFYYDLTGEVNKIELEEIQVTYDDITGTSAMKWVQVGTLTWDEIAYIGFSFGRDLLHSLIQTNMWVDNLEIIGNVVRMAADNALWDISMNPNPAYKYGVKMLPIKDSVASTDNLVASDDDSPLAQTALGYLLMYGYPIHRGVVTIPLDPTILAGQLIKVSYPSHSNWPVDAGQTFKTFRITEVMHNFGAEQGIGAFTRLQLADDLRNSIVRGEDEYSRIVRALSPDFQNKTYASLFATAEWDIFSPQLGKGYSLP